MRVTEITTGRRFAVAFDDGEDFFASLQDFCHSTGLRAGHIPTLIGGFSSVRLVGTCGPLTDPERPLWDEIEVKNLEVLGGGTLAWDAANNRIAPHIHVSAGLKADSADGRTSHLLGGTVQFITELVIEEWVAPAVTRLPNPNLFDVPLLTFGEES
ncbi:PPC domain-containing DNA-binding protein [Streptomyces sp. NPDC005918]|uniref:PPC domain-containing DNA-binding protein n=1 Tax=Streptomyces sp. NPDC005918 TaxID=3155454 RepID=UPI00340CF3C7